MTKNIITKARIILVQEEAKEYPATVRPNKEIDATGFSYTITCGSMSYFAPADDSEPTFKFDAERCTHFRTLTEAKSYLNTHKAQIREVHKEVWTRSSCGQPYHTGIHVFKIEARFMSYYDPFKNRKTYDKATAEKWYKNALYIHRRGVCRSWEYFDFNRNGLFTATDEGNCVLFEFYDIKMEKVDDNRYPVLVPSVDKQPFRFYGKDNVVLCAYHGNKIQDVCKITREDNMFERPYYNSGSKSYGRSTDISSMIVEERDIDSGELCEQTRKLLYKYGCPQYFFDGSHYYGAQVESIQDMGNAAITPIKLYSDSETQICKDITDYLANIPFDDEHAVVKYKNGYILRLGCITQIYKFNRKSYNGESTIDFNNKPHPDADINELVFEQYHEFARLFINNTFSTRSLSLATDGGRKWRHDGIHLIDNLFVANPSESRLGIDVEAKNRKALETLYTIHPKLKYMKKYMEKHPDVLYNSCVPFLRALFQYNKVLETFISLGKDSIFWEPATDNNRRHYYGWRSRSSEYNQTVEIFDMEKFVERMGMKHISQTGDFYNCLGLTKQQFKLIFDDLDNWDDISHVLFDVEFNIPQSCQHHGKNKYKRDGWHEKESEFRFISYEDVRLVVEITKNRLAAGTSYYEIANSINMLYNYYKSFQRVHKALVIKQYDSSLLADYFRMRQQLEQGNCPDYKASIWDMFPDDNEDLVRYHDRIMFMHNEYQACNTVLSSFRGQPICVNPSTGVTFTLPELYLFFKDHSISASSLNEVIVMCNDINNMSLGAVRSTELLKTMPTSNEEIAKLHETVTKIRTEFQNIYSMYWESDYFTRWHGSREENSARNKWGMSYQQFIAHQLNSKLDLNRYDMYIRLRRRFAENDDQFNPDLYPFKVETAEQLDSLYNQLAEQEPRLEQLIAERERQRRLQIQRENEAKTAKAQELYLKRYDKLKFFNYKNGSEYCIVVPKNLVSLIVEGQTLHHCVGSFVDSVSEGKDTIVFLRKSNDVETPYVTISLQPNGKSWYIDQAHGDRNSNISDEDVAFLKEWAEAKGIILSSVKKEYGLACHR